MGLIREFFMPCDNFEHVINVKESFHLSPNFFGQYGNILVLENFQASLGIYMLPKKIQANYEGFFRIRIPHTHTMAKINNTIMGPPNNNNNNFF